MFPNIHILLVSAHQNLTMHGILRVLNNCPIHELYNDYIQVQQHDFKEMAQVSTTLFYINWGPLAKGTSLNQKYIQSLNEALIACAGRVVILVFLISLALTRNYKADS
jgi:hypothetical protein